MDLKQAAEQAIVAGQAQNEKAKREEERKLEQLRRGESDDDLICLFLKEEERALIDEFVAAVPSKCWTVGSRKYRHSDGTVRMSQDDRKKAQNFLRSCDPKYMKANRKCDRKKMKKLENSFVLNFSKEGAQRHLGMSKKRYGGSSPDVIFLYLKTALAFHTRSPSASLQNE